MTSRRRLKNSNSWAFRPPEYLRNCRCISGEGAQNLGVSENINETALIWTKNRHYCNNNPMITKHSKKPMVRSLKSLSCLIPMALGVALACPGAKGQAIPLPYSTELGADTIRQLVAEEVVAEVRSVLLDHPDLLRGVSPSAIRVSGDVEISLSDEEGYQVDHAKARIFIPDGVGDEIDRDQIRQRIEAVFAEKAPEIGAIQIVTGVYKVGRSGVLNVFYMKLAAGILACVGGILALGAVTSEWFRRRKLRRLVPVWVTNDLTTPDHADRINVGVAPAQAAIVPMEPSAPNELTSRPVPMGTTIRKVDVKRLELKARREQLPAASAAAIDALAKLPLDEALGVLRRFHEDERGLIIDHLPVHPALKQRLIKGLQNGDSAARGT